MTQSGKTTWEDKVSHEQQGAARQNATKARASCYGAAVKKNAYRPNFAEARHQVQDALATGPRGEI